MVLGAGERTLGMNGARISESICEMSSSAELLATANCSQDKSEPRSFPGSLDLGLRDGGELCNVTWTGGRCFVGDSNSKPASLRNLVGVEVTLCTDAEEGGRVGGWEGDKMAEAFVDLEGGGPEGVLLGDILDFALLVEKALSFFVVDWGVSEAARLCLTKRLGGLVD